MPAKKTTRKKTSKRKDTSFQKEVRAYEKKRKARLKKTPPKGRMKAMGKEPL